MKVEDNDTASHNRTSMSEEHAFTFIQVNLELFDYRPRARLSSQEKQYDQLFIQMPQNNMYLRSGDSAL